MKNLPSRKLVIAQIFVIFILPVILLYFNILPVSWRMVLLAVSSLFIYGIIRKEEWTHEEMGLRNDNFKKGIPFYLLFTIIGIAILYLLDFKLNLPNVETQKYVLRTWIFFIPISVFQEFAFRSFLIPKLKKIFTNNFVIILVNAVLFTLIHTIYPNLGIGLPLAFLSGILFAWLYIKYPNLVLVSISHAVLNIVAVLLGFFTILK
ncbi:MAG TPA: type II CAAX endopeptidase family protein [Candidatus Paceibacterota bacterium]|nr:type II CAAX endopeptidase family protein [Candidatus Paceibacterota bacterium]HPT18342.1 type II CAAX endopeptidase family protein [Candidatus Paceibacterota bacterium]